MFLRVASCLSGILLACALGLGLAQASEEPLPPEQAFRLQASLQDDRTVVLDVQVAPGYYLYRDKFQFRGEGGLLAETPRFPQGEAHEDRFFGKQTIFRDRFRIELPVQIAGQESPLLLSSMQGCSENLGVCYPPFEVRSPLVRQSLVSLPASGSLLPGLRAQAADTALMDRPGQNLATLPEVFIDEEESRLGGLLKAGAWLPIVAVFLGLGVLLSFTPCVLPMVPILSGIIVGQAERISRLRAFVLSSSYVLGMALTYALIGVLAGLSGVSLSTWLQNLWVLGAFALFFVLLSLPMFGLFTLQLPAALQSRLSALASRQGGSLPGLAAMGALSALIVGPCMTAPLAAALLAIAQTGDALTGGVALLALGLGMGLPLILVGVLARHWLPRPGPWMELVKAFFGWLMLATALWLLYPVLSAAARWFCLALLLAVPAIVLLHRSLSMPQPAQRQGLRIAAAVFCLLAAGLGAAGLYVSRQAPEAAQLPFRPVASLAELDAALQQAPGPVMLDVYADWCVSCRELEHFTFGDPAIAAQLRRFTLLRADITHNTPEDRALLARFQLYAPPAMLFFEREALRARVTGFRSAEALSPVLARQLGEASP